ACLVELADDRKGRTIIVLYRRAFSQEFRIHAYAEVRSSLFSRMLLENWNDYILDGSRQNRAPNAHDVVGRVCTKELADLRGRASHGVQTEAPLLVARRADTDKRHAGGFNPAYLGP